MLTKICKSPLGEIILAAEYERAGLDGLEERETEADRSVLERAERWLSAFFAGERPTVDLPLAPRGTVFQRRVWDALRQIPYGETRSYGALAAALSSSPRAVGAAVGRNPLSLLIPCHRVLGSGGALTGYAGGLERKRALLALEQITDHT